MKKFLKIIPPVVVFLLFCCLPTTLLTLPFVIPALEDLQVQLSLNIYPGAEALGMVIGGHYGSNIVQKKINYWTSDPIREVIQYYQDLGYEFIQGQDEYGQWGSGDILTDGNHGFGSR